MQNIRIAVLIIVLAAASFVGCSELSDMTRGAWLGNLDASTQDAAGDSVGPDLDARDDSDVCTSQHHKLCVGGSLYWFDSCGGQEELIRECVCGCVENDCTPCKACPEGYVEVKPGTFSMGSPVMEKGRFNIETQHSVTISNAYCMRETETTQKDWFSVMGNNPSYFFWCGDDCPVEMVSWWDAVTFCNRLSEIEGLKPCYALSGCMGTPGEGDYTCSSVTFDGVTCNGYRLPSEAEWEYAARAGTTTATYNGNLKDVDCTSSNEALDDIAWFKGNSCEVGTGSGSCLGGSGCQTHPVKKKLENAWHLYDMLGNVFEWVWDWFGGNFGTDGVSDPFGSDSGDYKLLRGGAWSYLARSSRAANRDYGPMDDRNSHSGFRTVRTMCIPRCGGLECGDDGCEGVCGECTGGKQCHDGICLCDSHHHTECDGLDVVWFDSCGTREEVEKTCTCGCAAGACQACGCPDDFVPVPAGNFVMGSPVGDGVCANDDETAHDVTISRSFCMKSTETLLSEWVPLMFNPSPLITAVGEVPVNNISWWSALAYCNKLSDQGGLTSCYTLRGCQGTTTDPKFNCTGVDPVDPDCPGFRLPTEAEWEYAARAGTTTQTYEGSFDNPDGCESCSYDAILNDVAWWCSNSSSMTRPVGSSSLKPNAWNLWDMLGNVNEWVWDWYGSYPETAATDPTGPAEGTMRVYRGGAFDDTPAAIRAAARESGVPDLRLGDIGFRPVRLACSSDADCKSGKTCDAGTGLCVDSN